MSIVLYVKKLLLWGAGISTIVVPSSLLTLYHKDPSLFSFGSSEQTAAGHNVPFDLLDATAECKQETEERLGDVLLRSRVDWHSSRFQKDRNIYVVSLQADIGDIHRFEEANVYCYINPRTEQVSYFNAYDSEGKSYVSRAISFDSVLKAFSRD